VCGGRGKYPHAKLVGVEVAVGHSVGVKEPPEVGVQLGILIEIGFGDEL
jgi:hypothetical protein